MVSSGEVLNALRNNPLITIRRERLYWLVFVNDHMAEMTSGTRKLAMSQGLMISCREPQVIIGEEGLWKGMFDDSVILLTSAFNAFNKIKIESFYNCPR